VLLATCYGDTLPGDSITATVNGKSYVLKWTGRAALIALD
jgi:hypothetical protein